MFLFKKEWLACALVGVISACSSNNFKPEEPAELVPLDSQVSLKSDWDASGDHGTGDFFSVLNPAIGYNTYFVADRGGQVQAYDTATEDELWSVDVMDAIDTPAFLNERSARLAGGLVVGRQKVFVGSEHGVVIALDATTGKVVWHAEVADELISKPVLVKSNVVFHGVSGALYAFDVDDGQQVWQHFSQLPSLTLRGTSEPVNELGAVLFGTSSGKLVVVHPDNGQLLFQKQLIEPKGNNALAQLRDIDTQLIVHGPIAFYLGYQGQLGAMDIQKNILLWKRSYSGTHNMASDGHSLYLIDARDVVIAVNQKTGAELWRNDQLTIRQLTAPAVIDDYLVVADFDGYVHVLDKRTGALIGRERMGRSAFQGQPVLTEDGKFLLQNSSGDVMRLAIKTL